MTHLLGAVLRGLRARATLSVGSVILMALALGSAVLGPVFAAAVTNSYVVTRLTETPANLTGLSWEYTADSEDAEPAEATATAVDAASALLEGSWGQPRTWAASSRVRTLGATALFWYAPDACQTLPVTGRCPEAPGEALMSQRDLERNEAAIGDTVPLTPSRDPRLDTLPVPAMPPGVDAITIVGSYVPPNTTEHWLSPIYLSPTAEYATERKFSPYVSAPIFVDSPTLDSMGEWTTNVETPLVVPPDLTIDDLDAAVRTVEKVPREGGEETGLDVEGGTLTAVGLSDLPAVAAQTEVQRQTAQSSIAPAVLSLVLVALALLMRLLSSASELRMPEIALASLRGLNDRRLWLLGLAEPLLLLLVALPLGVAAGLGAALGLVRAWLVPGLPLPLPWVSVAAVALVLAAAGGVAALAVGRVVSTSLVGQLAGIRRPVAARRWALVAQLALVAVTLAILLSKVTGAEQGEPDVTDLILPVLLAVVAGLAATRLIALVAAWWSRRPEKGSGSLTGFVASRAIARRQEGTLVILPVTAAVAVGVFGLGVYDSAAQWRTSVAATVSPAHTTWTSPMSLTETYALTRRLDPSGEYLMASALVDNPGGNFSVVDSDRLAAVSVWPDEWGEGRSVEEVAEAIGLDGEVPVLDGKTLRITVDNQLADDVELKAELRWGIRDGYTPRSYGGPFPAGVSTAEFEVPECPHGCALEGITFGGGAGTTVTMDGSFTVTEWTLDGERIDPVTDAAWAPSPAPGIPSAIASFESVGGAMTVDVTSASGPGMARLTSGGVPAERAVFRGELVQDSVRAELSDGESAVPVTFEGTLRGMPFVGRAGMLVDLVAFTNDRQYFDNLAHTRLLSTGEVPDSLRQELTEAGFTVEATVAGERKVLDQGAYPMALRLYAIVAALALLTAFAGVLISNAMQMPARRRDAAALRVVGVPRTAVVKAVTRELAVVLGGAAVAGVVAGTLAQWIVLRSLTLGEVDASWVPELVVSLTPLRAGLLAAAAVAVLWVVALGAAWSTVRGARGATLRENAR